MCHVWWTEWQWVTKYFGFPGSILPWMLLVRLRLNISLIRRASWQAGNLQTAPRSTGYPAKHWTEKYFHLSFFSLHVSSTVLQDFRPKAAQQLPILSKFRHMEARKFKIQPNATKLVSSAAYWINFPAPCLHGFPPPSSLPLAFLNQKDKHNL